MNLEQSFSLKEKSVLQLQICPDFVFGILAISVDTLRREKGRTVERSEELWRLSSKKEAFWII